MNSESQNSEQITYREISLYLLGEASDSVRERINADVKRPDSQVMAFLEWMGDPDSNMPDVESVAARSRRTSLSLLFGKPRAIVAAVVLACCACTIAFFLLGRQSIQPINRNGDIVKTVQEIPQKRNHVYVFPEMTEEMRRQSAMAAREALAALEELSSSGNQDQDRELSDALNLALKSGATRTMDSAKSQLDRASLLAEIDKLTDQLNSQRDRLSSYERRIEKLDRALTELKKYRDNIAFIYNREK